MGTVIQGKFGPINGTAVLYVPHRDASVEELLNVGKINGCFSAAYPLIHGWNFPHQGLAQDIRLESFDRMMLTSDIEQVFLKSGVRGATVAEMLRDYIVHFEERRSLRLIVALGQLWKNPGDNKYYTVYIQHNDKARFVLLQPAQPDDLWGTLWRFPVVPLSQVAA